MGADTEVPLNGLVIAKPLVISAVGEYTFTYTAVDSHGHKAEATRTVIVSDDATIPSITLVGEKEISLEGGTDFEDPGVTLKDRDGNDLDAALVQVSGKVLTRTPGTYTLAYDYSAADGKSALFFAYTTSADNPPYTSDAMEWAGPRNVALFGLMSDGRAVPYNAAADRACTR